MSKYTRGEIKSAIATRVIGIKKSGASKDEVRLETKKWCWQYAFHPEHIHEEIKRIETSARLDVI